VTWIEALHNGLLERAGNPSASLLAWATMTAELLLDQHDEAATAWESVSMDGGESPWCLQERKGSDGKDITVISSLNRDLKAPEKRTGLLRSRRFSAPAKLSFWLCGHHGLPAEKGNEKNVVQLVDAATQRPLRMAVAPRTDVAQPIEWDLADIQGKTVQLEIVDGDNGPAYAWLGVGRFEPEVVSTKTFSPANARQKQLKILATVLRTTGPVGLRDRLNVFLPKPPKSRSPSHGRRWRPCLLLDARPLPRRSQTPLKESCFSLQTVLPVIHWVGKADLLGRNWMASAIVVQIG